MRSVRIFSVNTKNLMYFELHMAGFVKTSDRLQTQISERRRTPMQATANNYTVKEERWPNLRMLHAILHDINIDFDK